MKNNALDIVQKGLTSLIPAGINAGIALSYRFSFLFSSRRRRLA